MVDPPLTETPCPVCLELAKDDRLRMEVVQPLAAGAWAPLSKKSNQKICFDCSAAETIERLGYAPGFEAARIAVGNDRQEQFRLPSIPMGLVKTGLVRPSKPGDFERHLKWLDKNNWFGVEEVDG